MRKIFIFFYFIAIVCSSCKKEEFEEELNYNIYDSDFDAEPFLFIDSVVTEETIYYNDIQGVNYKKGYNYIYARTTATSKNFKLLLCYEDNKKIVQQDNPVANVTHKLSKYLYNIPEANAVPVLYKSGSQHTYTLHLSETGQLLSKSSEPFVHTQP